MQHKIEHLRNNNCTIIHIHIHIHLYTGDSPNVLLQCTIAFVISTTYTSFLPVKFHQSYFHPYKTCIIFFSAYTENIGENITVIFSSCVRFFIVAYKILPIVIVIHRPLMCCGHHIAVLDSHSNMRTVAVSWLKASKQKCLDHS